MSVIDHPTSVLSVTEATNRGVSGLVKDTEAGQDIVVERHGRAVAAVVSTSRFAEIKRHEEDVIDLALVLTRIATDDGRRTDLADVISALGFNRDELQAELRADRAAGRD